MSLNNLQYTLPHCFETLQICKIGENESSILGKDFADLSINYKINMVHVNPMHKFTFKLKVKIEEGILYLLILPYGCGLKIDSITAHHIEWGNITTFENKKTNILKLQWNENCKVTKLSDIVGLTFTIHYSNTPFQTNKKYLEKN